MSRWSFFDPMTGALAGKVYDGPFGHLALNTPPGHTPIEGDFDPLSQRIDPLTLAVLDWQPPKPDDDDLRTWAWATDARRWLPSPTLAARKAERTAAVDQRITAAELRQARPLREISAALASGATAPAAALERLAAVEADIEALRATRRAIAAAATPEALDEIVE